MDENTVHIKSTQTERDITARHIVIATGGRPSIPYSIAFSSTVARFLARRNWQSPATISSV